MKQGKSGKIYGSKMNTTLLVYIINFFSLIISVMQLCVASSIFDFIVFNRMYYTAHDEVPLIDPSHAIMFFAAPLLSITVALITILTSQLPRGVQECLSRHAFMTAFVHATLLCISSLGFAFCSLTSAQLSIQIRHFAYVGVPDKFRAASFWYFIRLRATTILFGLQAIFFVSQIALLYMGIECRYSIISPTSPPPRKASIGRPSSNYQPFADELKSRVIFASDEKKALPRTMEEIKLIGKTSLLRATC